MIDGYDHFSKSHEKITAEHEHWIKYAFRNIDAIIKIVIKTQGNLECVICQDLSLHYQSPASLASHYKHDSHRKQIAEYYLKHFATKTPKGLRKIMRDAETPGEVISH